MRSPNTYVAKKSFIPFHPRTRHWPILDAKCGMLQQASFYANQWVTFKKDVTIAEAAMLAGNHVMSPR